MTRLNSSPLLLCMVIRVTHSGTCVSLVNLSLMYSSVFFCLNLANHFCVSVSASSYCSGYHSPTSSAYFSNSCGNVNFVFLYMLKGILFSYNPITIGINILFVRPNIVVGLPLTRSIILLLVSLTNWPVRYGTPANILLTVLLDT